MAAQHAAAAVLNSQRCTPCPSNNLLKAPSYTAHRYEAAQQLPQSSSAHLRLNSTVQHGNCHSWHASLCCQQTASPLHISATAMAHTHAQSTCRNGDQKRAFQLPADMARNTKSTSLFPHLAQLADAALRQPATPTYALALMHPGRQHKPHICPLPPLPPTTHCAIPWPFPSAAAAAKLLRAEATKATRSAAVCRAATPHCRTAAA